ncbi:hypothetical protein DPMN_175916 [Dreissena polymorpha]|uniref:Uncharacterized protein n=1 Tax=Dreissena polymorpha TaxID=45954 RepID=A0A9D4E604_DREPO|nr:hypothetical protein DPMN_175916 [Dreissena polymorpha]
MSHNIDFIKPNFTTQETNVLTKFHEQTRKKNAPPLGSHVFQAKVTIFELIHDIIGTNHLSRFHEDRKINVAARVLTRKNAPPPGGHIFQPTDIIFELVHDIIGMNLLTKFHDNRTINVASRVKNAPPLGSNVFQANVTIFELIQDIIETNLLTKFHILDNKCGKSRCAQFQCSSAYSVEGDSGQDGQTDRRTAEITRISPRFSKSVVITRRAFATMLFLLPQHLFLRYFDNQDRPAFCSYKRKNQCPGCGVNIN